MNRIFLFLKRDVRVEVTQLHCKERCNLCTNLLLQRSGGLLTGVWQKGRKEGRRKEAKAIILGKEKGKRMAGFGGNLP